MKKWKRALGLVLLALVLAVAVWQLLQPPAQEPEEAPGAQTEQTTNTTRPDDPIQPIEDPAQPENSGGEEQPQLPEDGAYTSRDDVALYLHLYGHLPDNFITKKEAQKLGWSGGSLERYAPGCCIGGDRFGNYEGLLPEKSGRTYWECDIDTLGASSRGAKRIVFSNDGLIYYTEDHYSSFTLLYGEVDG